MTLLLLVVVEEGEVRVAVGVATCVVDGAVLPAVDGSTVAAATG